MFAPKLFTSTLPGLALAAALLLTGCENNPTTLSLAEELRHSTQGPPPPPASFSVEDTAMPDLGALVGLESASASLSTQTSVGTMSGRPRGTAWSRGFSCDPYGRNIVQNFPDMTSVSGGEEAVIFMPVLHWFDFDRWVWRPWVEARYTGKAGPNGMLQQRYPWGTYFWAHHVSDLHHPPVDQTFMKFERLPAKTYYAVRELYIWPNGVWTWRWSALNGTNSTMCLI